MVRQECDKFCFLCMCGVCVCASRLVLNHLKGNECSVEEVSSDRVFIVLVTVISGLNVTY